jgi:hypothetical protein
MIHYTLDVVHSFYSIKREIIKDVGHMMKLWDIFKDSMSFFRYSLNSSSVPLVVKKYLWERLTELIKSIFVFFNIDDQINPAYITYLMECAFDLFKDYELFNCEGDDYAVPEKLFLGLCLYFRNETNRDRWSKRTETLITKNMVGVLFYQIRGFLVKKTTNKDYIVKYFLELLCYFSNIGMRNNKIVERNKFNPKEDCEIRNEVLFELYSLIENEQRTDKMELKYYCSVSFMYLNCYLQINERFKSIEKYVKDCGEGKHNENEEQKKMALESLKYLEMNNLEFKLITPNS